MFVQFFCHGHPNIRATHLTTIEFTAASEVTVQGDCIVGVKADFRPASVKKLLSAQYLKVTMEIGDSKESFMATTNPQFSDEHEIVFRRSGFASPRTLGIDASKAAIDLPEAFRQKMKDPRTRMIVTIEQR